MTNEVVYEQLRSFLDRLPTGFPKTPTGVELKILRKLFSPEAATLTMQLSDQPETVDDIAARTGIAAEALADKLESMAQKGLIFRVWRNGQVRYQAYQFMVGIYEFQLHRLDREFCELFEEYLPHFGLSLFKAKTSQMRVIPLEEAVETATEVATYDRIRQIVRRQPLISASQCICRQEQALLDKPCSKPPETCLGFGDFARFYLDNGLARRIDADEAFAILDQAEAAGLVLMPTNSKEIEAICCCCTCCCGSLRYARIAQKPARFVLSHYQARIDGDTCTDCEDCLSRCPMIAITLTDAVAAVNTDRCIGCGLCVPTCPSASIVMIAKPGMPVPPDRFNDTIRQIQQERRLRP